MNSKGFTLVELLSTIVILAIIVALAVPGYNYISTTIRENNRESVIKQIEIQAARYAFDTGETIVFVDKLVTEGYYQTEDEDGNIFDPVNNERLNCYIVEMEKVSDYYKASFKDGKNYDVDGVCDLSKLEESSEDIMITIMNNGVKIEETNSFVMGNILLKASSNTLDIDCLNNKCSWISRGGASIEGKDEININNISNTLDTVYTFQYTVYSSESSSVKRFTKNINIKIDNENPTIYQNEIKITNRYIYANEKKVNISASDGKGSGISGYYLAINNKQDCNSTALNEFYQTSNEFIVKEAGTYLICVKDKVGNVTSYGNLKIDYFV